MAMVDLDELRRRSDFITERPSPDGKLLIWNYNARCQYERAWDDYTTMARGLITDTMGKIVKRGFKKFWNLGEMPETCLENLPAAPHHVYEKEDGSLGILYIDGNGDLAIATRGSFDSMQARWATAWFRERLAAFGPFQADHTYLFEIIFPQNRIVVDYGTREELVLLAAIDTETGQERDPCLEAEWIGMSSVRRFDFPLEEIERRAASLGSNQEGYVVHYPSTGLRLKVKGAEYVRLHRLLTGFTARTIWEYLSEGRDLKEMLEIVPDEFYTWVKVQEVGLLSQHEELRRRAREALSEIVHLPDRKAQALHITAHHKEIANLIFGLLDGRDIAPMIWKRLRPEHALPFRCAEP